MHNVRFWFVCLFVVLSLAVVRLLLQDPGAHRQEQLDLPRDEEGQVLRGTERGGPLPQRCLAGLHQRGLPGLLGRQKRRRGLEDGAGCARRRGERDHRVGHARAPRAAVFRQGVGRQEDRPDPPRGRFEVFGAHGGGQLGPHTQGRGRPPEGRQGHAVPGAAEEKEGGRGQEVHPRVGRGGGGGAASRRGGGRGRGRRAEAQKGGGDPSVAGARGPHDRVQADLRRRVRAGRDPQGRLPHHQMRPLLGLGHEEG